MNRKRAILTSCSIILLCTAIIVGVTYALFSEQVSVTNHLQAGELKIRLTRTELHYNVLNEDGYLEEMPIDKIPKDFSTTSDNEENIFGINNGALIVPGSFYEATMQIENYRDDEDPSNNGDVAFTYQVQLKIDEEASKTDIARQINVTVTTSNGATTKKLSEFFKNDNTFSLLTDGMMDTDDEAHTFKIKIEFVDDDAVNNDAQGQGIDFDLYVIATQRTPALGNVSTNTTETDTSVNETDASAAG